MKLQTVKTKNKTNDRFTVIKKDNIIAVKKGKNIYDIHPLMFFICDRTKIYSSPDNDRHEPFTERKREVKPIKNEEGVIKYWFPYKPGQRITGQLKNDMFYDNKRAVKLKELSYFYKVFK